MANRYAVATGNWSNTATWNGGTLPQAGDVVRPNGFTVTIDQDVNVAELRRDASLPAAANGTFLCSTTRTITATVYSLGSTGSTITFSGANNSVIVGDVFGSAVTSTPTIQNNSTGIISIVGNIGSGLNGSNGITCQSGSWQVVGDITGASINLTNISTFSGCTAVTITGNVYTIGNSGANQFVALNNCTTITVYGNLIGNGASTTSRCISTCTNLTLYGNATSIGTQVMTGVGNMYMEGIAKGGLYNGAACNTASGLIHCEGANDASHTGVGLVVATSAQINILSAKANGNNRPFSGANVRFADGAIYTVKAADGSLVNFGIGSGQAATSDVRNGTVYANGALTGTCAVPPAASVALNVPVDNTVGSLATAAVVAADLLNEMNTSSLTIAQGLRDGMGASAAAIAAVGSIQAIP